MVRRANGSVGRGKGNAIGMVREGLDLVRFKKGERKDDVMQNRLRRFQQSGRCEGVVFVP